MIDTPYDVYQRICQERDRYKRERDDLKRILLLSHDGLEATFDRILGADDPLKEPLPRQAGQSQSG